jgi:protocatechuate 3,4-dioxygenase, alpha subunit
MTAPTTAKAPPPMTPTPPATPTSSQTIGPFWHPLADPALADLTRDGAPGPRLELSGTVRDGDGAPVTDACIELWQPLPTAPDFAGWGRCATDGHGRYRFVTLRPPAGTPISVVIMARGLLRPLWTRVYFEDGNDELLSQLPAQRRATLLARQVGPGWQWDVRLQGDDETVFLEL